MFLDVFKIAAYTEFTAFSVKHLYARPYSFEPVWLLSWPIDRAVSVIVIAT